MKKKLMEVKTKVRWNFGKNKQEIIVEMIDYSCQLTFPFTSKEMADYINSKFHSNYSNYFIRKYMKYTANLKLKS